MIPNQPSSSFQLLSLPTLLRYTQTFNIENITKTRTENIQGLLKSLDYLQNVQHSKHPNFPDKRRNFERWTLINDETQYKIQNMIWAEDKPKKLKSINVSIVRDNSNIKIVFEVTRNIMLTGVYHSGPCVDAQATRCMIYENLKAVAENVVPTYLLTESEFWLVL